VAGRRCRGFSFGLLFGSNAATFAASCSARTVSLGSVNDHFIDGDDRSSTIDGSGGQHLLEGLNCNDTLNVGPSSDNLGGDSGQDIVRGQEAGDEASNCGSFACGRIQGGTGNDTLYGNIGSDDVWDLNGNNDIDGMSGVQTTMRSVGRTDGADIVGGDDGDDDCSYDAGDTKISCEIKSREES
jgi:Ca2+-binding RTX toxin-like protein